MKKKLSALLCAMVMICSCTLTASAEEQKQRVYELGDGFYVVETIVEETISRAGGTKQGSKEGKLYNGSTLIGTAVMKASFTYTGSTATATSSSISGSGFAGWSYDYGNTSRSGATATGTAYFSLGSVTKSVKLTLTCAADGTLS